MIIKSKDDSRMAVAALEALLGRKTTSKKQREAIEEEMNRLLDGVKGEKEAAYHIDFHLKDSKNWAVIHDLRLEHNGRVAQIDHLLVGRFFDIFVIESKNYTTQLRVDANGEFEVRSRLGWKGIASPIEQNKRHIIVLNELIRDQKLMPMRLGLPMRPAFRNWILVPPECNISRRRVDEAIILKMDMFERRLGEFMDNTSLVNDMLSLAKISSTQTIMEFARKLVSFHRPASCDYAAKFGISQAGKTARLVMKGVDQQRCQECGVTVEAKVAAFCRTNSQRFGKRILCRVCQVEAPAPARKSPAAHPPARQNGGGTPEA
jgi:hypothetical protein